MLRKKKQLAADRFYRTKLEGLQGFPEEFSTRLAVRASQKPPAPGYLRLRSCN